MNILFCEFTSVTHTPVDILRFFLFKFCFSSFFLVYIGRYNDSNLVAENIARQKKKVVISTEQIVMVGREDHAAGVNIEATEVLQVRCFILFFLPLFFFLFFSFFFFTDVVLLKNKIFFFFFLFQSSISPPLPSLVVVHDTVYTPFYH